MKKVWPYLEIPLAIAIIFPTLFLAFFYFDESHKYVSISLQLVAIIMMSLFLTWKTDRFESYMSVAIPMIFSVFIWSFSSSMTIAHFDNNLLDFWITYFAGITSGIVFYLLLLGIILTFFLGKKYEFFRRPNRSDLHTLHIVIWYFIFMAFSLYIVGYIRGKDSNYWMIIPFVSMLIMSLSSLVISYEK